VDRLSAITQRHGILPERICFEITESKLLHDQDIANTRLDQLRKLGYRVALDDFGTGYSSLAYLHQLPVHLLKIDRRFVQEMTDDEVKQHLIRAVVLIAQELGMEVVVEGVETKVQHTRLVELGCTLGQGYTYARPMPIERIVDFCAQATGDLDKCSFSAVQMRKVRIPSQRDHRFQTNVTAHSDGT